MIVRDSVSKLHPLLRLAVISGVETAVRLHISRGDDLNARDASGATPLILAAARNKVEVIRILLGAGADPTLADSNGMDALAHASASGCSEAVALLVEALAHPFDSESSDSPADTDREAITSGLTNKAALGEASAVSGCESEYVVPPGLDVSTIPDGLGCEVIHAEVPKSGRQEAELLSLDDEPLGDDFGGEWEADEYAVAPKGDESVADGAKGIHDSIATYKPVDTSEDWGDVQFDLPEKITPLQMRDDDWSHRAFLLAALREGVVSEGALVRACADTDGTRNEEAERILAIVATELGASIVEWAGRETPFCGKPSVVEDQLLDEAMEFANELASDRNDPFLIYTNDIQGDLLTAEEEVALARQIEEAGRDALTSLARWPMGLALLFEAADCVARGEADAKSFSSSTEISIGEEPANVVDKFDLEADVGQGEDEVSANFVSAVAAVRALVGDPRGCAEALAAVSLTRGFLAGLATRARRDPAGAEFIRAIKRQSFARERMTLCNLRLALSIAKKYRWSEVPLDDLVQEANIGLMKAVDRYDWRKGFRFSTYATWWIRQQVSRSIADTARLVRVPVHVQETARRVMRERETIERGLGRTESNVETALRTGISLSRISLILSVFEPEESLDDLDLAAGVPRVELIVDENSLDPAEIAESKALRAAISALLDELDERNRKVITLRFGFGSGDPLTLEEVGQTFGVTRERIRQIESKALRKLSHANRKMVLDPFMGDSQ